MDKLNVVFRVESNGDVLAVFPSLPADYHGSMGCYAHKGQHSSCSLPYYYSTKPATREQYAPLLTELRGIYENGDDAVRLVPRKRITAKDNAAFAAERRRWASA